MGPVTLVALVGFALVAVILVGLVMTATASNNRANEMALSQKERAELEALRALVDDLKETAWDHRELDSALSVILIDMIRTYERHGRRELP